MTPTKLVRVIIDKRPDGLWDVVRERARNDKGAKNGGGEGAVGLSSLDECLEYVRVHDEIWEEGE